LGEVMPGDMLDEPQRSPGLMAGEGWAIVEIAPDTRLPQRSPGLMAGEGGSPARSHHHASRQPQRSPGLMAGEGR